MIERHRPSFKREAIALLVGTLLAITLSSPADAAIRSGASCKKVGASVTREGTTFQCKTKAGKKVWVSKRKAPVAQIDPTTTASTPSPQPTPSPVPTVSKRMPAPATGISIYRGGAGKSAPVNEKSFDLPVVVAQPPSDSNLKLWVYDPDDRKKALRSSGVFFQREGSDWVFLTGNSDGSVYAKWNPGKYFIDTVEPEGRDKDYIRKRYEVIVDTSGRVAITGLDPNPSGYFTLTITKNAPQPKTNTSETTRPVFVPASACQLRDQTTNMRGMVGFPKREYRLPSEGKINALIIPIDFSDVPGKGAPQEIFSAMTDGTAKFFYDQSGGRVQFNFQTIENWVRAPFLSTAYGLGRWSGGDANGYFGAALALADPLVDYSLFDVVYVLSPKEIPSSSIAYGPAFVSMPGDIYSTTNDGLVRNGSFSGADAWQSLPGAGWKWMAHETGHLFGLHDLYVTEGPPPYGSWDIMSLNWTTEAIALNAWNRYLLGWLEADQVSCLEQRTLATGQEIRLIPIERDSAGIKSAMVPLSSSKILVMESRRNEGFDSLASSQEGVLVYTVDMTIDSIKGGWKTQRRPGSIAPDFMDATLKPGDKITVEGVTIEVLRRDAQGDVINVRLG